ncbi:MAG: 3-hydroxyacyl-CoA dehydrogenase family protein, partial [Petrotogales bacterium]
GKIVHGTIESTKTLLSISQSIEDCVSGKDLAIETVSENLELKRQVLKKIDQLAHSETLIATNSSSIPGSRLADATNRPEKVINFNFGPPDDIKVEVMGNPNTSQATVEAVLKFVRSLNLVPIFVKREIMGYAINRVWRAVKKEVLFLLDGGYITAEDVDRGWMLEWGTQIGPCGFMDIVGLDVVHDIEMVYYEASKDKSDKPPKILKDMIKKGKLGVKAGEGFYKYPNPSYKRTGWLKGKK